VVAVALGKIDVQHLHVEIDIQYLLFEVDVQRLPVAIDVQHLIEIDIQYLLFEVDVQHLPVTIDVQHLLVEIGMQYLILVVDIQLKQDILNLHNTRKGLAPVKETNFLALQNAKGQCHLHVTSLHFPWEKRAVTLS
jgi:hypothetical protein